MRETRTRILSTAVLALLLAGPALPATAQSVGATVTVDEAPGACLLLTAAAVDFGTLPLSQAGKPSMHYADSTYGMRNCGEGSVRVDVRATNATGSDGASWTLTPDATYTDTCAPVDVFSATVMTSIFDGTTALDVTDVALTTLAPNAFKGVSHLLTMPCHGSSGVGETASFDIVYTATTI